MILSIAETILSDLLVRKKEHDIRSAITHEYRHATGQNATIESFKSVCSYDELGSLKVTVANSLSLSLSQILDNLKWPDEPVSEHSCGA